MVPGGDAGGILRLGEVAEAHPVELARDFREKFGLSSLDIGDGITFAEAWLLFVSLMSDPSSWVQAAVNRWKFPVSREWILTADAHDRAIDMSGSKSPQKYYTKRPWPDVARRVTSKGKPRTAAEAMKILRPHLT